VDTHSIIFLTLAGEQDTSSIAWTFLAWPGFMRALKAKSGRYSSSSAPSASTAAFHSSRTGPENWTM
jgi:hypothetical protein